MRAFSCVSVKPLHVDSYILQNVSEYHRKTTLPLVGGRVVPELVRRLIPRMHRFSKVCWNSRGRGFHGGVDGPPKPLAER